MAAESKTAPKPMVQPCVCPGHTMGIVEINYSPVTEEGTFFVSASMDKKPMLRDGDTGDWIGTFEGHKGAVWSAKLNRSATKVATGAADFSAKVWDAITGEQLLHLDHKHIVKTVDFSHDEKFLLTGGHEKQLRVFDLASGSQEATVALAHPKAVRNAVFSDDMKLVFTGADDNKLRVWDLRTATCTKEIALTGQINCLELSTRNNMLTTVAGKQVTFFNMETFDLRHSHTLDNPLQGASLHPDGGMFVTGGDDSWVRVLDLVSGEELACNKGHHGPVHCVAWHPNGSCYTSGSGDATIRIWPTAMIKGGDKEESKRAN